MPDEIWLLLSFFELFGFIANIKKTDESVFSGVFLDIF